MSQSPVKSRVCIYLFMVGIAVVLIAASSCKRVEQELEIKIETVSIKEAGYTHCIIEGRVIDIGEDKLDQYGFCYGLQEDPTIFDDNTQLGERTTTGAFTDTLTGLQTGTVYFVRSYAQAGDQLVYDDQISFTTLSVTSPVVVIDSISDAVSDTAVIFCKVTDDGGGDISGRGVCWDLNENPSILQSHTMEEDGAGAFTSIITALEPGSQYYVRAYATNNVATGYSLQHQLTTPPGSISIITDTISAITQNTAVGGGNITDDGGSAITARGVCWSSSQDPTLSDNYTSDGTGTGSYSSSLGGLECNTIYYVRAYATNALGTTYGSQVSFTTSLCPAVPPTLTTTAVTGINATSAVSGGNISADGGAAVVARGVCWSTSSSPTIADNHTDEGSGTGSFTSNITGLAAGKTYYVRAYATNSAGTSYGNEFSFTTPDLPTVSTLEISDITDVTAQGGGEVSSDGGATVTSRGVCWSTTRGPTTADNSTDDGTGQGSFTSSITGLSSNTTYYVRAYATNSVGTRYGPETSFRTWAGSVSDFDGNSYFTVEIGDQTWMAANLATTHYSDGTAIPFVEDAASWDALAWDDKAYCWYDNSTSIGELYGGLYTWAAAMNGASSSDANPSGVQGICPSGWHLPGDDEWQQLEMHLGMSQEQADSINWRGAGEGGMMKEAGIEHWLPPNKGASNESGFTALPGGFRHDDGSFLHSGLYANIWSATIDVSIYAWYRTLGNGFHGVRRFTYLTEGGFSVRCVKDN